MITKHPSQLLIEELSSTNSYESYYTFGLNLYLS